MRKKNILLFVVIFALFIIIIKVSSPSLILSNKGQYQYAGITISDSGENSGTKHNLELTKESLMKFKIASVTNDSDIKVELISEDTGEKFLDLYGKNLTHSTFKSLPPGKYTFIISSFSNPTAYNYRLNVSDE